MNFNALVKKTLCPTLNQFDFHLKNEENGLVEFDSNNLLITFSYDYHSSYEIDFTLLFKVTDGIYSYSELEEYINGTRNDFTATQSQDESFIKSWIIKVDTFLRNHLPYIQANYLKVNFEINSLQQQRINEYNNNRDERALEETVNKFWQTKEYVKIIELLTDHTTMSNNMKMKYKYALKMVNR